MTPPIRRALAGLLGAATVLGVAFLSHAPWRMHHAGEGVLRLSLSARPERVERCRTLSEAELASRPAHMRQPVACEGSAAHYRLTLALSGRNLLDQLLTGGGARSDRPLRVLREFPVSAGPHQVRIALVRVDTPSESRDHRDEGDEPEEPEEPRDNYSASARVAALPPQLVLDTTVVMDSRRVLLVTYDPTDRRLVVLAAPRTP